jgi:DNA-binding MarR family transcriptional regulator
MKNNDELIEELMYNFRNYKKIRLCNEFTLTGLTHNEIIVLFVLNDISSDKKVLLSTLRERIKLAPSTVTPIITLLEQKGLIERDIDKEDRRNIYICISPLGEEYTKNVKKFIKDEMNEYIEYIGEEDTKELIKLISKTINFFNGREENKI